MSTELVNGHASLQNDSLIKTKKRKHVDENGERTKKTKKRKELPAEEVVTEHAEEAVEVKKKMKKKRSKAVANDPTNNVEPMTELVDTDIPDAPRIAMEETNVVPDTPVKKNKRSKNKSNPQEDADQMPTEQDTADLPPALVTNEQPFIPTYHEPCLTNSHVETDDTTLPPYAIPTGTENSPFHSVRLSLYVSLPPISLTSALKSLCSLHLTPLLLSYYGPVNGVILCFSDPILSAVPNPSEANKPLRPAPDSTRFSTTTGKEVLATCADDAGASWIWLTATFLIFHPETGTELEGWMNVCSEGFIGLVVLNYWQVGIGKDRIPKDWSWIPAGGDQPAATAARRKKAKMAKLRDEDTMETDFDATQTTLTNSDLNPDFDAEAETHSRGTGYWSLPDGTPVSSILKFRVVDCEVVSRDRDKWTLQIEGTLLATGEEEKVLQEERVKYEKNQARRGRRSSAAASQELGDAEDDVMMSGALLRVRASSEAGGSVMLGSSQR